MRLPGRRADRPRADDHGGRRPHHRRARRQARAVEAARGDRGALRRGPRARRRRAADGDRRRPQQARLRAGRLPRPRARRRGPRDGPGGGRHRRCAPARSCACTRATPAAPTATCARRSAMRMEALGGRQPPARSCSPATGAARHVRQPPTTTPRRSPPSSAGAPAAGVLRGGRDRAGRRRVLPARLHGHGRGLRRVNARRAERPADRRDRRHRPGDRAGAGRARARGSC